MAFFDDLGKKISSASQSAVQKTQDFATVTKLNSEISSEEKKINNLYVQIGKLYASLHGTSFEPEFEELISALHQSENTISEYKKRISEIKGVARCEKCGAEVVGNSAFCSNCGAPMAKEGAAASAPAAPAVPVCPNCGAETEPNASFCTKCGTKLK